PAPALPHRPRGTSARHGPRPARDPRWRGRAGLAQGARRRAPRTRPGGPDARLARRCCRWIARRDGLRRRRRRHGGLARSEPHRGAGRDAVTYRIAVVTAGLREPSSTRMLADRLGEAAVAEVIARGELAEIEVVDLRLFGAALANGLITGVQSAG